MCKVVIGSEIWETMDTVFSSCDIMLANYTKDPHLKITIEVLCDEVSIKENVLISQVFQPYDGYNCLIKTVVRNEIEMEAIDDLANDEYVTVFLGKNISMINTRIETVLGNVRMQLSKKGAIY